ncbi:unnamed protein product [Rangifer tarandus platyrhynchus]|uniref:Uncharacterized protein n=2 Tax=Rangifer tarandus platyrhynchus TaxID=3082113 RepID=A0ABN8YFS6_RANTA|nr:unnamed protein product [Rangifer tarandus platyrhynchus]CAI9698215.1 unnamed protein product [Rangifer tarandus platyrhynchus]
MGLEPLRQAGGGAGKRPGASLQPPPPANPARLCCYSSTGASQLCICSISENCSARRLSAHSRSLEPGGGGGRRSAEAAAKCQ